MQDRPSTPVARTAPLSYGQSRLWLLDRLFPGDAVYNEVHALRLAGALDRRALATALDEIVRRHGILRTRFEVRDGEPVQVVAASPALDIVDEDLRGVPAASRTTEAESRLRDETRRPFALEQGPPVRVRLLQLADDEHWLVVAMHHIVTDGWSVGVLWRELALCYDAFAAGRRPALSALAEHYADFALRQREWLAGPSLAPSLAYWKQRLDALAPLEIPTDRPRPAVADHAGGRVTFAVAAPVVQRLRAIARGSRATPFMALAAAFGVLLHRYGGQDDIALGVPVAGRTSPSLEPLIGFFVNMLVLRTDFGGAPTFVELLGRVRERALEAYEHQQVPFERLVMELAPARDASRNPLFQASVALHGETASAWRMGGLRAEPLDAGATSAKFDLALTLVETGDGLRGSLDYASALFDAATAETLAAQYVELLGSIAANPAERIGRLALHDARARASCLARAHGVRTASPRFRRVEQLVGEHVAARPDAVAIAGSEACSYRALDERANRLARELSAASPVRSVGVCLERGGALVVAMLATLKAGAAYVPLDPEHPDERLQAMLADASVDAIVTEERWSARFESRRVLCVDRDAPRIAGQPGSPLAVAGDAGDVACVMFTSGSTGRPKGVPVTHRSIANLVRDTDYAQLRDDDVVAHLSNPAFDAATFEIWGALANGAALVPIDRATVLAPRALAKAFTAARVTTAFVTTALFNAIAREAPDAFAGCRHVLFGGEAVEPRWVREVLRAGAPRRLVHVYGPTETTTFATWHEVTPREASRETVPIGAPIANAEAYVLDAEGEPTAPGVPGEIHIGGAGVASGYLGAPPLGDGRFVPHPFSDDPAARLFRTGDRARCRGDGAIEFLGRADRQVKIRGQRIELGEVEGALARLPYVRDAVVLARGTTSDTRRLVAWLVPSNPRAPPPDSLRRDLRRLLPEAMLPAATVWLPSLPLTANGKIDTRALPEPGDAPRRSTFTPPRDMFEGVLVRLWEDVLGIRGVGVHDRFFEIGGHSLLAARLVDTIERETGLALPLTALFADDTVDGIARALREGTADAAAPIVAVNAAGSRPPFVFLHGDFQAGGFYSRALARALGPDQPTYIVHPHGLAGDAVPATIEAMATERIAALRALCPRGPYVVGGHCNGALVAFEIARQLISAGDEVPAVVLIESRAPGREGAAEDGGVYVKFDAAGRPTLLAPHDRLSAIELAYTRAIDAYRGGPLDGHAVVIQAEAWRDPAPDAGWARLARSVEGHVVRGDHVTLITRHLGDLARIVVDAIERVRIGA